MKDNVVLYNKDTTWLSSDKRDDAHVSNYYREEAKRLGLTGDISISLVNRRLLEEKSDKYRREQWANCYHIQLRDLLGEMDNFDKEFGMELTPELYQAAIDQMFKLRPTTEPKKSWWKIFWDKVK